MSHHSRRTETQVHMASSGSRTISSMSCCSYPTHSSSKPVHHLLPDVWSFALTVPMLRLFARKSSYRQLYKLELSLIFRLDIMRKFMTNEMAEWSEDASLRRSKDFSDHIPSLCVICLIAGVMHAGEGIADGEQDHLFSLTGLKVKSCCPISTPKLDLPIDCLRVKRY